MTNKNAPEHKSSYSILSTKGCATVFCKRQAGCQLNRLETAEEAVDFFAGCADEPFEPEEAEEEEEGEEENEHPEEEIEERYGPLPPSLAKMESYLWCTQDLCIPQTLIEWQKVHGGGGSSESGHFIAVLVGILGAFYLGN